MAEFFFYGSLRNRDQLANITGSGIPKVYHDVRMDMRYLRATVPEPLEPNLVNQASGPYSLDLFEDRTCTGMKLKPGVPGSTPAQVLLHDAMHGRRVTFFQLKGDGKRNVPPVVKHAGVVSELHVLAIDSPACSFFSQQVG